MSREILPMKWGSTNSEGKATRFLIMGNTSLSGNASKGNGDCTAIFGIAICQRQNSKKRQRCRRFIPTLIESTSTFEQKGIKKVVFQDASQPVVAQLHGTDRVAQQVFQGGGISCAQFHTADLQ